jgi:hypothetical protein
VTGPSSPKRELEKIACEYGQIYIPCLRCGLESYNLDKNYRFIGRGDSPRIPGLQSCEFPQPA